MKKREDIPVGGYVPLPGFRAYCVEFHATCDNPYSCRVCAFEGVQRCAELECSREKRADGIDVVFTIKLKHNETV